MSPLAAVASSAALEWQLNCVLLQNSKICCISRRAESKSSQAKPKENSGLSQTKHTSGLHPRLQFRPNRTSFRCEQRPLWFNLCHFSAKRKREAFVEDATRSFGDTCRALENEILQISLFSFPLGWFWTGLRLASSSYLPTEALPFYFSFDCCCCHAGTLLWTLLSAYPDAHWPLCNQQTIASLQSSQLDNFQSVV